MGPDQRAAAQIERRAGQSPGDLVPAKPGGHRIEVAGLGDA